MYDIHVHSLPLVSVPLLCVCVCERERERDSLSLTVSHTPQTHRFTHFHVEMGRIRVGSHQRFHGFDITLYRGLNQRRVTVLVLGGGEIEEERLVYRVLCV